MAWTFYDNNGTLLQGTADNAVTTGKLVTDAVTTVKITDANVTTAKIADDAVTSAKIAAGTIVGVDIADGVITAQKIASGAVGSTQLANNQVTGAKIALGSDAAGDIMYYNGTDYVRLAKPGTPAGEALTFAASATAPSWVAASSGVGLGMVIALGG